MPEPRRPKRPVPSKRVTLADVAKLAGLSRTAASMILTGRPDTRLSAEAHAKVMAAADQLGYRPNVAARSLDAETHEFQKSGGGVKCLSLELRGNEAARL